MKTMRKRVPRQPLRQPRNPTNKTRAKQIFGKRFKTSPQPKKGKGSFSN